MRGVPLTPEQRAERSKARRAFARKLALRSMLAALALGVLAFALLYWLLTSIGGRDVLLAQVVARLPPGATLTWERAEGPVSGPLTMHGVRFDYASDPARPTRRITFTDDLVEMPLSLRFFAGGDRSVRGYEWREIAELGLGGLLARRRRGEQPGAHEGGDGHGDADG